jgi:DNA-binding SARP family transcriptional activator/tetratricopeptide (TPR) repeat protein
LGPVGVSVDDESRPLNGPRRKALLAVLALRRGEIVSIDWLVDVVWGDDAPSTGLNTVQSHVSHLRRILGSRAVIVSRPPGYVLNLDMGCVDVEVAERLIEQAQRSPDHAYRCGQLQLALDLWDGPALVDVAGLTWLDEQAQRLERLRWHAERMLIDSRLELGEHAALLPQLERLSADHPFDEQVHRHLILALYRSGRQADALAAYAGVRLALNETLGLDPSRELRELETAILQQDPSLEVTAPARAASPSPVSPSPVSPSPVSPSPVSPSPVSPSPEPSARPAPAQLPADVHAFTGRTAELSALDALLEQSPAVPAVAVISAIAGTAGAGKTALAVRWAHRVRDHFPDGQLYVNLRGYDPDQPMLPADALAGFLHALGAADSEIPLELDVRAAAYRTLLDGRQVLVLLDNASSVEQIRPLLPGSPSCLVVVTSRDSLAGLVARHGARRLDLDLLPRRDAVALLHALIGPRVDAEPQAAAALVAQCARLPLALRVAAELAVTRSSTPLSELVAGLADQQPWLDQLDAGGDPRAAVTSVFSWSVQHLPRDVAAIFALLGLHPGPDFDAYAVAALADSTVEQARRAVQVLARAHLIRAVASERYGMHDLLRAYATQLAGGPAVAAADGLAGGPRAALSRMFDYYLGTAAAAMDRLFPAEALQRPRVAPAGTPAPALSAPDTARAWLDTEAPALVVAVTYLATHGWPAQAVQLSTVLHRYLAAGRITDALTVHGHARDAARRSGNSAGEALALLGLGAVFIQMARYGQAGDCLESALALFRQAGDQVGEARALGSLGAVEDRQGRFVSAGEYAVQALALFRQAGDQGGEIHALLSLAVMETHLGRYDAAADRLQDALDLSRQNDDAATEADALSFLGEIEVHRERFQVAADHLWRAIAIYQQVGDRYSEAWTLDGLGTLYRRLGEPETAAEKYRQSLALLRELGDRSMEAWVLNGLGEAALQAGQPAEALSRHAEALTLAVQTGGRDQQARAHEGLGRAQYTRKNAVAAREHFAQALTLFTDLGMPEADKLRAYLTGIHELVNP